MGVPSGNTKCTREFVIMMNVLSQESQGKYGYDLNTPKDHEED